MRKAKANASSKKVETLATEKLAEDAVKVVAAEKKAEKKADPKPEPKVKEVMKFTAKDKFNPKSKTSVIEQLVKQYGDKIEVVASHWVFKLRNKLYLVRASGDPEYRLDKPRADYEAVVNVIAGKGIFEIRPQ